jgi:hypothetical protein
LLLAVALYFITARMLHELAAMERKRFRIASKYWLHDRIQNGHIQIVKDATTGVYLFPDHPTTLEQLRQLQAEPSMRVSFTAPR